MLYKRVDVSNLTIDERELSRRLSTPGVKDYLAEERWQRLIKAADLSYLAERVELRRDGNGIFIGNVFTDSRGFLKVAEGADECFIMTCTLGLGVDSLIYKEQSVSVYGAFVTDAMADALIEALADFAESEICAGEDVTPRFSPGYSDLPLSVGEGIASMLGAGMRQGIRFSESGIMIPKKSISAIACIRTSKRG